MSRTKMVEAYEAIRTRIADGRIQPGSQLVNRSLAVELGVSTITLREAIHRLTSDGLVEHVPHAGAFVRRMGRDELIKLYEFRHTLEVFAAREAAVNIRRRELERLQSLCDAFRALARRVRHTPDRCARGDLLDEWIQCDVDFHLVLYAAADNPWLTRTAENLGVMSRIVMTKPPMLTLADAARTLRTHLAILRALRVGDVDDAERWMNQHNEVALAFVLEHALKEAVR